MARPSARERVRSSFVALIAEFKQFRHGSSLNYLVHVGKLDDPSTAPELFQRKPPI
jgi:hypothetical protein